MAIYNIDKSKLEKFKNDFEMTESETEELGEIENIIFIKEDTNIDGFNISIYTKHKNISEYLQ